MTQQQAMLAAIFAAPDDDLVRLAYADWLDENDVDRLCGRCLGRCIDPEETWSIKSGAVLKCKECRGAGRLVNHYRQRAALIRVQCELAALDREKVAASRGHRPITDGLRLFEREAVLQTQERQWWIGPDGAAGQILATLPKPPHPNGWGLRIDGMTPGEGGYPLGVVRRGFVALVRCRLHEWMGRWCHTCDGRGVVPQFVARDRTDLGRLIDEGDARIIRCCCSECYGAGFTGGMGPLVIAEHPVVRVEITDREPCLSADQLWWVTQEEDWGLDPPMTCRIPAKLGCHGSYPTTGDAVDVLSDRLLRWAKPTVERPQYNAIFTRIGQIATQATEGRL